MNTGSLKPRWWLIIIVVLVGAVIAFQVIRTAVVSKYLTAQPAVAARAWPNHPRVELAMIMAQIGQSASAGKQTPSMSLSRAMLAAKRGPLLIEPLLIKGAQALSQGKPAEAEKLFREARRRDPRSAAARFFLAQYYLGTGRPVEGLAEASVLTRLVAGGSSALVPGLVQYARTPGAAPNLQKIFAANPGLGDQVLAELARDSSNAALILSLAPKILVADQAEIPAWQTQLIRSLIAQGKYREAHSLWLHINELPGESGGLFNPQFARLAAPAPFNWTLGSNKFGVAEPSGAGDLKVLYYGRDDGEFASQLLLLAPGNYQLRMKIGRAGVPGETSGLSWSLSCLPGSKQLLTLPLGKSDVRAGALVGEFAVPAGCPAQQLVLRGTAREFAESEEVIITNLHLVAGVRS